MLIDELTDQNLRLLQDKVAIEDGKQSEI